MRRKGISKHSFPRTHQHGPKPNNHTYQSEATMIEYAARLREIPPDTRTPAQRLLGDPIRSALMRRQTLSG